MSHVDKNCNQYINLSLEFMKNPATDFTNSRGFIKNSAKIGEIRGKKR